MTVETMVAPAERGTSWSLIGKDVSGAKTAEEAVVKAGLDWSVGKYPLTTQRGKKTIPVQDRFAVLREDTDQVLGIVGKPYVPFDNREAFSFMDALVDSDELIYETAGPLRGGRVIWLLAKTPQGILIAGEEVTTYLLLATSHDGSKAISVAVTPVRVICENTLNLALATAKQVWSVYHTQSMQGKLQEARETLELTFAYTAEFELLANELLDKPMTTRAFSAFTDKLLPEQPDSLKEGLRRTFADSPTLTDVRHTAWGALNAVGEFFEWNRPRQAEARVRGALSGRSRAMRDRALVLLK